MYRTERMEPHSHDSKLLYRVLPPSILQHRLKLCPCQGSAPHYTGYAIVILNPAAGPYRTLRMCEGLNYDHCATSSLNPATAPQKNGIPI